MANLPSASTPKNAGPDRLNPERSSRVYYHLTCLRKAYEYAIQKHINPLECQCILDYGCGDMPYRPLFNELGAAYHGYDLKRNPLANGLVEADGTLVCDSRSVDVVLSSQVLEHVHDPRVYLSECHRVLDGFGLLLLSTHGVWKYHPDPNDFWRWTSAGLKKLVEESGFEIVDFKGIVGPAATGIQLWQDAMLPRVPKFFRGPFCRTLQWLMQNADLKCGDTSRNNDASVYLCVARKR